MWYTHESFKTGRVVRVWPLKDSLSPNSGSQDRTASPKSSEHNVIQHEESYKCTSVEECGGESYWK